MHSSYVYLLIFQIIIVVALVFSLLALIVRRMRGEQMAGASAGGEASAFDAELDALSKAQAEKIRELEAQVNEMGDSSDVVNKLKEQNDQYSEKVKYLEQKLLEYEILQEEIGTLSQLKVENEKLKKRVLTMSAGVGTGGD